MSGRPAIRDPATLRRLAARHESSPETVPEIAAVFHVHERTAFRYLRAMGRSFTRLKVIPRETEDECVRLYGEPHRMAVDAIAQRVGCCAKSVLRILRRRGVKVRPQGRPKAATSLTAHPADVLMTTDSRPS